LAKPTWSTDTGRGDSDFWELLKEEEHLNKTIDFSFKYRYQGTGNWGDQSQYEISVPDKSSVAIPEKEMMFVIPITELKKKDTQ
jgi:hypothetical protein